VIDDANHVTLPWGSVNSRVFDALASGTLVVTNGALGSQETFNGKLPVYNTSAELCSLLRYYLTNDKIRETLVAELSQMVRKEHSYRRRAEEFADILNDVGVHLHKKDAIHEEVKSNFSKLSSYSSSAPQGAKEPLRAICVGVRTYDSHNSWLEILLRSLVAQHSKSPLSRELDLQIFIADTERVAPFIPGNPPPVSSLYTFSHVIEEIVNRVNKDLDPDRSPQVHVVWDLNSPSRTYKNPFYGYDLTDNIVDLMTTLPQCEWMMMTNGDNAYNSAWFDAIAPITKDKNVDLIGWDFITHHKRDKDGINRRVPGEIFAGQQPIRINLNRGFCDLASILVRTSKVVESKGTYLPDSLFTRDLFARDFHSLTEIVRVIKPQAIKLIHRIFLIHQ
jgi:hypothetical protein